MTHILVLSDTHLVGSERPGGHFDLFDDLAGYIRAADLIIHAGDHTGVGFYYDLLASADLISVCGNTDTYALQQELPARRVLEKEGVRIGIMHGWGSSRRLEDRVFNAWESPKPDVMIFGHSHLNHISQRDGKLLFNPGSPTAPRGKSASAGWLVIDQGEVKASIIHMPKNGGFP